MRRIVLIGAAIIASLAMSLPASARLGVAPLAAQEDSSLIQVRHGGHHGHRHHGHRHHGWHRGRGHHRGWYKGRGHHKWHHHRRHHRH